jgi:hypothetical protein
VGLVPQILCKSNGYFSGIYIFLAKIDSFPSQNFKNVARPLAILLQKEPLIRKNILMGLTNLIRHNCNVGDEDETTKIIAEHSQHYLPILFSLFGDLYEIHTNKDKENENKDYADVLDHINHARSTISAFLSITNSQVMIYNAYRD